MRTKIIFAFALLLTLNTSLTAQKETISQEKALAILSLAKPDYLKDNFNVYVLPQPISSNTKIKYIRTISSPDTASWFFFIDEKPYENWSHPCFYIFINKMTGSIKIINSDFPPDLSIMKALKLKNIPSEGKHFSFEAPTLKALSLTVNHDYAIIISGGMDNNNNYRRYWNDCAAIYSTLVNIYGYDKSHIKVLMSDGINTGQDRIISVTYDSWGNPTYTRDSSPLDLDGDGTNDINYSATKANIKTVFNNLSGILTSEDHLFIFTTDHGGLESGNDVFMNLWGEEMRDDELAIEINKVNSDKINIVMEQCHSGGFIDDLSGNYRIIATACSADQLSNSRTDGTYDEFVYHWISAIASKTPDGTIINADSNNDGWVSIQEAYNYAVLHDVKQETPQYSSAPAGLGCITKMANNCYLPIANPTLVCSSGATFTVNNPPSECSVTWNSSPNISRVSPQGSNPCTFSTNGSGIGSVSATINSGLCQVVLPQKPVWVGTPSKPTSISGFCCNGKEFGSESIYKFTVVPEANQGADQYAWVVSGGTILEGQGTHTITVETWTVTGSKNVYFDVNVNAGNNCGWSPLLSRTGYVTSGSGPLTFYVVYPNPTSSEVAITIKSDNSIAPGDKKNKSIKYLRVVDKFGSTLYSRKFDADTYETKINVSDFPTGVYIIKINEGIDEESHSLVKQ